LRIGRSSCRFTMRVWETAAEEEGMKVLAVISLVDREEGGSEELRKKYPYYAICTARELLAEATS